MFQFRYTVFDIASQLGKLKAVKYPVTADISLHSSADNY